MPAFQPSIGSGAVCRCAVLLKQSIPIKAKSKCASITSTSRAWYAQSRCRSGRGEPSPHADAMRRCGLCGSACAVFATSSHSSVENAMTPRTKPCVSHCTVHAHPRVGGARAHASTSLCRHGPREPGRDSRTSPSPGADVDGVGPVPGVGGVDPVPAQAWQGCAVSELVLSYRALRLQVAGLGIDEQKVSPLHLTSCNILHWSTA